MNKKSFYITTTLPYVNAKPHIGFAREVVQADVLARYQKLLGKEVYFNTGTDEHGQKIYQEAKKEKLDPKEYADKIVGSWKELENLLDLEYDRFIRTTDEDHIEAAKKFWQTCDENGYIYKKDYKTKYCVGCELEKTDSELVDEKCPDHPNQELEIREEENYFFRFSQFQEKLLDFYQNNPDFVKPAKRFNEVKKFIENGPKDFSISRLKEKMPWGIEVPEDPDHVMYVWFDALVDYISTLEWPYSAPQSGASKGRPNLFKKFWEESEERVQFCGKDNLRQQSAMWQSMLMAAEVKNSSRIFVNGFIIVDGQKMSKSIGNVISPKEMVERYGTDGTRYLLLSTGSFGEDTDITWEKLDEKYNADLANGLGNLLSRVIKLARKDNFQFSISNFQSISNGKFDKYFNDMALDQVLKGIWDITRKNDQYIEEKKPWELAKSDPNKFKKVISEITEDLAKIAIFLEPFMPDTSGKIKKALETKEVEPLFERIDTKQD